jgi:hypothetical protein
MNQYSVSSLVLSSTLKNTSTSFGSINVSLLVADSNLVPGNSSMYHPVLGQFKLGQRAYQHYDFLNKSVPVFPLSLVYATNSFVPCHSRTKLGSRCAFFIYKQ